MRLIHWPEGEKKISGKEAIDTLVKAMEDYKTEIIVILVGYEKEMERLAHKSWLGSRFPIHLHFPDYNSEELLEIAHLMVTERQYQLSVGAAEYLRHYLEEQLEAKQANFSNARLVRNIVEKAIRRQALRLVNRRLYSRDELMLLRREDVKQIAEEDEDNFWQT